MNNTWQVWAADGNLVSHPWPAALESEPRTLEGAAAEDQVTSPSVGTNKRAPSSALDLEPHNLTYAWEAGPCGHEAVFTPKLTSQMPVPLNLHPKPCTL